MNFMKFLIKNATVCSKYSHDFIVFAVVLGCWH